MQKALLLAFCLLAGCGSYSESGLGSSLDDAFVGQLGISRSGVTDTPLAANAYRIRGYGNQNASFEKTNAVAMVRAAVLASNNGFEQFQILDFQTWEKSTLHSTPVTARTSTNINAHAYSSGYVSGHATSTTTFTGGVQYTLDRPRTDIVVKFVPINSPDAANALRVADVVSRYGKKAGLSREEIQAAMTVSPTKTAEPTNEPDFEQPPSSSSAPMVAEATAAIPAAYPNKAPTLDQLYKALSPSQKAWIDSLPPGRRADALMQIRDGSY
jgi:hypothetical protein